MFRLEDMKKYIILSLLCGCLSVNAQTMVPLTYRQYMERVAEGNLEYASEKFNVPAAKAEVTAAKVFNDPNLSVSYFNNENNSLQMGEGVEVELSKTFSFAIDVWLKLLYPCRSLYNSNTCNRKYFG